MGEKEAQEPQKTVLSESDLISDILKAKSNPTDGTLTDNLGEPQNDEDTPASEEDNPISPAGDENNPSGDDDLDNIEPTNRFEKSAIEALKKRIGKKTKQNHDLENEIARLKAQIQKLEDVKNPPENPIDAIDDENGLDKFSASLIQKRDWLQSLLAQDAPIILGEGENEKEYTRSEVLEALRQIQTAIDSDVPNKRKEFSEKARKNKIKEEDAQEASKCFSWFSDEDSAGRRWVEEQLASEDTMLRMKTILCYAWEGLAVNKARKAFKDSTAKPRQVPPVTVPTGAVTSTPKQTVGLNPDGSLDESYLVNEMLARQQKKE